MLDLAMRYTPAPGLQGQELDGETVLLDVQSATYFSLNKTGTHAWRLLAEQTSLDEICRSLARAHALPPEEVVGGVVPFIEELLEAGLIHPFK